MLNFSFPDTAKYKAWTEELKDIRSWKRRNDFFFAMKFLLPIAFDLLDIVLDKIKKQRDDV